MSFDLLFLVLFIIKLELQTFIFHKLRGIKKNTTKNKWNFVLMLHEVTEILSYIEADLFTNH